MTDIIKCPLCGVRFDPETQQLPCKTGCGSSCRGCTKLVCPRCGYSLAGKSKILQWIEKLFDGKRAGDKEKISGDEGD